MTDFLKRAFPYLLLAPSIVPLVYVSGLVFPYVSMKTFSLWTLGILATATFVFLALTGQPFFYRRLRHPASWIPLALLAVEYLASAFGIGFYHSFWGLFERGDGLLTSTIITLFFYLILVYADRVFFERLVRVVATVAGIVAVIAVLQWATASFGEKAWFLPPVSGRIGSTFGNAAFLAAYLGMAFFVTVAALRDARGVWHRVYKWIAVLSVVAILLTATRGSILALVASLFVALVYTAFKGEGGTRERSRQGLLVIAVLAILFVGFRSQLAHAPFEPIRRIASISFSETTVASRLFVWQHIGAEALQRPFLGYGAEHIGQLFDKIYDPELIVEQWFDRSHNSFLDYFAGYGIFGLALYLALLGSCVVFALRLYRRFPPGLTNPGLLFSLLILTYAVQNFFVFDTPASLWLLYALLASLLALSSEVPATRLPLKEVPVVIPAVISGLIVLLMIPAVILPLSANVLLTRGYLLHVIDVNLANAYFERGLALNTYADLEYGYQAYNMYTDHQAVRLSGKERVAAYNYALAVLSANFEKYPYDARTATYLGHVMDTAPQEVPVDEAFDRKTLLRATELSPLRAQAWYMLANIALRKADALPQGDPRREEYFREAVTILEDYALKEASLPVPRYILATLFYKLGDHASAKRWADEAYPLYTTPDTAAAGPAVKYYLAIDDWPHAVRFLSDLVADNPSDYDALYDLAKVTYLAGDPATAERIVVKLRENAPGILETDQNFLAAITAYEQSR